MCLAFALAGQAGAQASSGGVKAYQSYAREGLGGSKSQSSCLNQLWMAESGWNPKAQNPTSTAYGIAQFLDATWASTGIAKTSNPYRQIDAGLIYIGHRYGSPCKAWSFWQDNHWY
jgi:SLT domain-containing protein